MGNYAYSDALGDIGSETSVEGSETALALKDPADGVEEPLVLLRGRDGAVLAQLSLHLQAGIDQVQRICDGRRDGRPQAPRHGVADGREELVGRHGPC